MADSASESDSGSVDGVCHFQPDGHCFQPPSPVTREQLQKRIESLQQQNRVLNVELETYKLRVKSLQVSFFSRRGSDSYTLLRQSYVVMSAFLLISKRLHGVRIFET